MKPIEDVVVPLVFLHDNMEGVAREQYLLDINPAADRLICLKAKLLLSATTRRYTWRCVDMYVCVNRYRLRERKRASGF